MVNDDRRLFVRGTMTDCVSRERECQARFLECLGEFDSYGWYTFEACSSTFAFLTQRMRFCNHSAWRRLVTARAARRFPVILEMLRRGEVHMTGVALIAKLLDESNADSVLATIVGKTKRQIEVLVADLAPKPCRDSSVRSHSSSGGSDGKETPLGEGNWKITLYGDSELKALIDEARELSPPGMDLAMIVREALGAWVSKTRTRKFGSSRSGDSSTSTMSQCSSDDSGSSSKNHSRYIPAQTRRLVFDRDGGQCSFVDDQGRRCSARRHLQFDHVVRFGVGGDHSVENLRLLCAAHNRHAAAAELGMPFMGQWYRRGAGSSGPSAVPFSGGSGRKGLAGPGLGP